MYRCDEFNAADISKRWQIVREKQLCSNCLRKHPGECRSTHCRECSQYHHTLLHQNATSKLPKSDPASKPKTDPSTSNVLACAVKSQLLMSVVLQAKSIKGNFIEARALLDTGASHNFITRDLAQRLKLNINGGSNLVCGFGNSQSQSIGTTQLVIRSRLNGFSQTLHCIVVPSIAENIPCDKFPRELIEIPSKIKLADPRFHIPRQIDLIICSNISLSCLSIGRIHLSRPEFDVHLQKTQFGWVIVGGLHETLNETSFCNLAELKVQLQKFWEIENCGDETTLSFEDEACESHYTRTVKRNPDGRYVVRLPFKNPIVNLGNSRPRAIKQLFVLNKKFDNNLQLKTDYTKVIDEYLELNHMSEVEFNSNEGYFLPHHAVIKPDSSTTKTRVVFNASAKSDNGKSLNDELMVGPTIQATLFDHLLKFRSNIIAVIADIEKMYRQIQVDPSDRKFQKILWRKKNQLHTFQLNTVTFGVASAPFLAIRTLHQLASDEAAEFPRASRILKNDLYVDDFICGANSIEEVLQIQSELTELLKKGGFSIRKWAASYQGSLEDSENWTFDKIESNSIPYVTKTLGILWKTNEDEFKFQNQIINCSTKITKRIILSIVASIFDPLGLLGPVILIAKSIIQECWKLKLGWDETVTIDLQNEWIGFANQLKSLETLTIPRCLIQRDTESIEIHGFCDASKLGYGACIYVKSITVDRHTMVRLACSKSRVAPVKSITIPKLELCAALLLSQLVHNAINVFQFKIDRTVLWSDSEIALQWIKKPPTALKVFESNRVAKIQNLTRDFEWRHVPGKENPADILSRGQSPHNFSLNQSWFTGPSWLNMNDSEWPRSEKLNLVNLPGLREATCLLVREKPSAFYEKYSSYQKIVNIIAYMLRWRNRGATKVLTIPEVSRAELVLLKLIQAEQFEDEIKLLTENCNIKSTKFATLSPFLDSNGLIRVGGRITNSNVPYDQKHPVLLPTKHHVTILIIRRIHHELKHAGVTNTLYHVRQRFWVFDGKNQVRSVIRRCVTCVRYKPRLIDERMSDLPNSRVEQALVFARVGVDFCGPFEMKEKSYRNRVILKVYCCVFICMATKAVHLEVVSDMTTDAFIAALRRFIARRGIPECIYSDNGSNFIGAKNQLCELYALINSQEFNARMTDFASKKRIQWKFNPPISPHFGGLWEAAVRSFKHHLKRVVGGQRLTFEQLTTLTHEIESILNSRPISSISSDPNDIAALTPAHFLIGRPMTSLPDPDLLTIPENRLPKWKFIVKAKQDFWARWHLEYLSELQRRQKWFKIKNEIKIDSIVLIIDKKVPCYSWPLGKVVELHPGSDGLTRVVSIRIHNTIFKRNVTTLRPLPV